MGNDVRGRETTPIRKCQGDLDRSTPHRVKEDRLNAGSESREDYGDIRNARIDEKDFGCHRLGFWINALTQWLTARPSLST
jgi:hypothetical protein